MSAHTEIEPKTTVLAIDERLRAFGVSPEDVQTFQSIAPDVLGHLDWIVEPCRPGLEHVIGAGEMGNPCEIVDAQEQFKNWLKLRFSEHVGEMWVRRAASLGNWIFEHQVPGFYIAGIVSNCFERMAQLACEGASDKEQMIERLRVLGKFDRMEIELVIGRLNRIQSKVEAKRRNEYADRFRTTIADLVASTTKRIDTVIDIAEVTKQSTNTLVGNATEIASATEQSAQVMSRAADESSTLVTSIEDTRTSLHAISEVSSEAIAKAEAAGEIIARLESNSRNIESVVTTIRGVADLTKILALNATIEAARAGDAGRSFGVVADEVRSLADQTASATDGISDQVVEMQSSGNLTVEANKAIASSISEIGKTTSAFEATMDGHSSQVLGIVSMIDETAMTAKSMAETVALIQRSAEGVDQQAEDLRSNFDEINAQFRTLDGAVNDFLAHIAG